MHCVLNQMMVSHLIFKLSTKQILVTTKRQPICVPQDLIKAINETDFFNNKIKIDHFDNDHFIVKDDHSHNYEDDS